MLPTLRPLSEAAKGGRDEAKRPTETRAPGPKDMMREVRVEGGVQLTESAGMVDVDEEFSWC